MEEPDDMNESFEVISSDSGSPANSLTAVEQEPDNDNQNICKRRKIEKPEEKQQNYDGNAESKETHSKFCSKDLDSADKIHTKVEQEPKNELHEISKRKKIEKPETTHQNIEGTAEPNEKHSEGFSSSQDEGLSLCEKVAKNEALNLYQKLYSLHQSSTSDKETIAKDMEKEMENVLHKYKEEVRKMEKVRLLEARSKALSQYVKAMNELVNDASQQVLGYLPDVTIKAGHEKSKKESLRIYQHLLKSDCRLTSEVNTKELERILEEKFKCYVQVNKKKEGSALLKVKLRCMSEYLSHLKDLVKSNSQKNLIVNILRTSQGAIRSEILDLFKKITVENSAKVKEMQVEIEKAVDDKFQHFIYQYERQEVASLKHTCIKRYCEDIERVARKDGIPFISEANLRSAHRKIEDDIIQYYKKQTVFEDKLSNVAKAGLEEIKQEINTIFGDKVKENLEEEKVCVMEAKDTSILKYTITMNQAMKESNEDFITNVKLREKHEEAKEIALRFYREANHFDRQHPSDVAVKTLKELEDNELDSKLKDYEEQNILHQKSVLYMNKFEALNEYKETLKSNSKNSLDSSWLHDNKEWAFEKALQLFDEKSFSEIDSTEQTGITRKKLIKEMQNHLQERMHILYIMNPGYSLKKNISTKNRNEDTNLKKNNENCENKEERSHIYNPSGKEIETMLEKFPFAEVDLISRTLKGCQGSIKHAANKLIDMGYELQDDEVLENSMKKFPGQISPASSTIPCADNLRRHRLS